MGADWYSCFSFFGYEIKVPENSTYAKLFNKLAGLNSVLEEPFRIMGILSEFHSRMEGGDDSEMDESADLVIGFYPTNDFKIMDELSNKLSEYIIDNPLLQGLTFSENSTFYSGIEWTNHITYESDDAEDDEDEDEDEDDEDEDEDDDEDNEGDFHEDDNDDELTSDEENTDVPKDKIKHE